MRCKMNNLINKEVSIRQSQKSCLSVPSEVLSGSAFMETNGRHFYSLVLFTVGISEFIYFFSKCPFRENFESRTIVHLARSNPSTEGGEA